jgi:hypothetical protein
MELLLSLSFLPFESPDPLGILKDPAVWSVSICSPVVSVGTAAATAAAVPVAVDGPAGVSDTAVPPAAPPAIGSAELGSALTAGSAAASPVLLPSSSSIHLASNPDLQPDQHQSDADP